MAKSLTLTQTFQTIQSLSQPYVLSSTTKLDNLQSIFNMSTQTYVKN